MSDKLPKFEAPPVNEVVMSVQFDPITALTPVHLGRWWDGPRRERYPFPEERAPVDSSIEEFGPQRQASFTIRLSGPPTPAVWFFSPSRTEALQVQRDRFTRNWIRPSPTAPYPSYRALAPKFAEDFAEFESFLIESGLGPPSITQCEITYVNPIAASEARGGFAELEKLLAPWSTEQTEPFLPAPEDAQLNLRYVMSEGDQRLGRLNVSLQPALAGDGTAMAVLTLTARGRPLGAGLAGARAFLDLGHEWIVRGFTALTAQPMHDYWRRTQ